MYVCLLVCLPIFLPVHLSVCMYVCLPVVVCQSACTSRTPPPQTTTYCYASGHQECIQIKEMAPDITKHLHAVPLSYAAVWSTGAKKSGLMQRSNKSVQWNMAKFI